MASSEVERVSIAARALPSEPSAPCLVALEHNVDRASWCGVVVRRGFR